MLSNEKWFGASAGFYPETIDQSLRFEDGDSPSLRRTPSSAGNRRTWTLSCWLKRANIGSTMWILGTTKTASDELNIVFSSDKILVGDNATNILQTDSILRDTTNWYHIVVECDTTQASASDRMKIYINGTEPSYAIDNRSTSITQNEELGINNTVIHSFGGRSDNTLYFDGYFAEVNFIDGTALDPTSFGETKNGVWIPKSISGLTYGTNGYRFTFADSSSLGDDTSGNGNDFTSSGLASTDVVLDSPTNNFSTLNKLDARYGTLAEGNLSNTYATTGELIRSTFAQKSGKWYAEVNCIAGSGFNLGIYPTGNLNKDSDTNYGCQYRGATGQKVVSNSVSSYGATYGVNDIIGIAVDMDNNTVTFYKNNSSQGSISYTIDEHHAFSSYISSGNTAFWNFGQDSSFGGNETAQGNTDDNGKGDFYYAPPSGYLALCSANLPETTISPNQSTQADDHFNTVLYTGNATDDREVTGVGFRPDWGWFKERNNAVSHLLFDSSRGASEQLKSDSTGAESTQANKQKTFTNDGYTLGTDGQINGSSDTYVAWNWKAGGTTPTKTYKVVVVSDSGNKYRFRNSADSATFAQSAVTLDLQEGGTYVFDWSDSSAQGHPFRFSTTSDGTHGGGSEYTTGVVKDDSAYKTTITVAGSAPTLYYYCQNHSGMGGQVNTNTTHGSTNFDGSILSVSQTNETAGFSILTYTGTGSAGTIGHGLGSKPSHIIVKSRSHGSTSWVNYHGTLGAGKYLALQSNQAQNSGTNTDRWNNTEPTDSVFSVGTHVAVNNSSSYTYVAYVFAEIEGYSKFGSYTGNGSTDGTFVYTRFRPAWVMVKRTDSSNNWVINDATRTPNNEITGSSSTLYADTSGPESYYSTNVDFLSNGFKSRTTGPHRNASGGTYIYMAFAEQPFHLSNAR